MQHISHTRSLYEGRLSKVTIGYDFLRLSIESVQMPRLSVDNLTMLVLLCILIVCRRGYNGIGDQDQACKYHKVPISLD